jgi:serine/threonine-protein kinase
MAVKHPHVCSVHTAGLLSDGHPYMVMERLRGEPLAARLKSPMSIVDAVAAGGQLLDALTAIHAAGTLHRDIKPSNILVVSRRSDPICVKVIDFGLAKALPRVGSDEVSALTAAGVIPGTPSYLSPEQFGDPSQVDERTDVWAAGLTLFEMLAGRRAFRDAYDIMRYASGLTQRARISALRPEVPRQLERAIDGALEIDRDRRFRYAAEFRTAFLSAWARYRAAGVIKTSG